MKYAQISLKSITIGWNCQTFGWMYIIMDEISVAIHMWLRHSNSCSQCSSLEKLKWKTLVTHVCKLSYKCGSKHTQGKKYIKVNAPYYYTQPMTIILYQWKCCVAEKHMYVQIMNLKIYSLKSCTCNLYMSSHYDRTILRSHVDLQDPCFWWNLLCDSQLLHGLALR